MDLVGMKGIIKTNDISFVSTCGDALQKEIIPSKKKYKNTFEGEVYTMVMFMK